MQGGNISNKTAPYIGFDIDSLMFGAEDSGFRGKIMNFLMSEDKKLLKRPLKNEFIRTLNAVWSRDVSIILVTNQFKDRKLLEEFLNEHFIPYTRVIMLNGTQDIRDFPYHYFFSSDHHLISFSSKREFMHIDDLWRVL